MAVQVLRLLSGEELIGELKFSPDEGVYQIKSPAVIRITADERGQPAMSLAEIAPLADRGLDQKPATLEINGDHVTFKYSPVTQLLDAYNQSFGSGLMSASGGAGILLTE